MDNVTKISLAVVVSALIIGGFIYMSQVSKQNSIEKQQRVELENKNAEKEERAESLQTCLDESDYLRETSHIALCGDPNVGRSLRVCYSVFSGVSSHNEYSNEYFKEFSDKKIPLKEGNLDDLAERYIEQYNLENEILSEFWETCNCGLEAYRREELDDKKENRDEICFQKYGT